MLLLVRSQRFQRFCSILMASLLSFISIADEQPILDNYLLVSVARQDTEARHIRPQIYQIDVATGHARPLLRTDPGKPASLAIDHKRQVLYFVDRSIEMIGSVSLAQGNSSIRVIYRDPTLIADLDGLAVDTTTQKLYYCDGGSDPKIAEIDLLDQDRTQRIIISGKSLKPKAMAIDEGNSELYWTDWGSKPGIFVIGLEPAAQLRTLVEDNVVIPNALAIDFKEEVMYWVDAHIDRIEMANLDGQNRRALVRESGDVHYYAMTISPQFLYIADWTKSTVLRVNRLTNRTSDQMPIIAGIKTGIAYYNSNFTNVGRAGINRTTRAPQRTTFSTTDGKRTTGARHSKMFEASDGIVGRAGINRTTGELHSTTILISVGKVEVGMLVNEKGSKTVVAVAVTGSLLFLLLIISMVIWFRLRRRRGSAKVTVAVGYSPAASYDEGRSNRGRLLIEDNYAVNPNTYESFPEIGMPPPLPAMRPEAAACEPDDDWYMKLSDVADDLVKNTGCCDKPTEYDFYDDAK